jgi:hypothetical protein
MSLDTSNMHLVMTKDGYFRYVCHQQRILTSGFATRTAIKRNSNGFLNTDYAMECMRDRYAKEYPNTNTVVKATPLQQRRITLHQVFDRFFKGTATLNEVESAMNELERAAVDEWIQEQDRSIGL